MKKILLALLILLGIIILCYHNVNNSITNDDHNTFLKMGRLEIKDTLTHQQIINALYTQCAQLIRTDQPIPIKHEREPSDLFNAKSGYCYDWSRTFSKLLRYHGFQARQVSVYQTEGKWSGLFKREITSHAGVEIFLNLEWIYFDPYSGWWAEDISGNLYTTMEVINTRPAWKRRCPQKLYDMYKKGGHCLYGVYSRHGLFYPPYNFIPDYNLKEFLANFHS